jgi:hypothetical protein
MPPGAAERVRANAGEALRIWDLSGLHGLSEQSCGTPPCMASDIAHNFLVRRSARVPGDPHAAGKI